MKISLKLEYACRVLAQLGRLYGGSQLAHIEELAKIEAVPQNYLVQILNELRTGGLLHSRRGKQGGYTLAKPPTEISLHEIVSIVDPDALASKPSLSGQSGPQVSEVWSGISKKIADLLKKTTLASLIVKYNSSAMYEI
ncbi:MAG: Rrf2 family transcriptional regulator [Puniceicoccales bacterium]|jgi:Rrf2 family protein|nr:Rrf2 family transcriptional regulator [Puniceicoccales bacterium]